MSWFVGCRLEGDSGWDSQVEGSYREAREPHSSHGGQRKSSRRREQHQRAEREPQWLIVIDFEKIKSISTWRSISYEIFLVFFVVISLSLSLSITTSSFVSSPQQFFFPNLHSNGSMMVPTNNSNLTSSTCVSCHSICSRARLSKKNFVINLMFFFFFFCCYLRRDLNRDGKASIDRQC